MRNRLIILYAGLITANMAAWVWALFAFRSSPVLLGTALLAYTLGLRHAFDADHIAAIDNVTRKLMQENKRPLAAGLYFSLGHSSVVIGLSLAIALTAGGLQSTFVGLKAFGGVIGTSISAFFLIAIAAANMPALVRVYRSLRRLKQGDRAGGEATDPMITGLLGRLLRGLFRFIQCSWQMYPVGVLFGLGFDTATEVGLLGISASEASHGLPIWSILIFPALFTAGMSLADTLDSTLMIGSYGWALTNPARKLRYNLTVTFLSVGIALFVAGVELFGLIADKLTLRVPLSHLVHSIADNLGLLGIVTVVIFAASWATSVTIHRARNDSQAEIAG